jgi:hypothetical protein
MTSETGAGRVTQEIAIEAWRLRRLGVYSMRDLATRFNVDRDELIDAIERLLAELVEPHADKGEKAPSA